MPRTYATKPDAAVEFWESRSMRPGRVNTLELVRRRAAYVFEATPKRVRGSVIHGDIRTVPLSSRSFTHVITSPPYLGMRTYVPDQWLRNWFLGADENVTYDESQQIARATRDSFVGQLAPVWRRVASACVPGARLAIRFGALPSIATDPGELIAESLATADAGWRIHTTRRVSPVPKQRRQATQFSEHIGKALHETDVYAYLSN